MATEELALKNSKKNVYAPKNQNNDNKGKKNYFRFI